MKTDEPQGVYATKAKTIFRTVKNEDHPFVMIDRRPVENPDLSWGAKGVLSYLLSRPDNWTVRLGDLIKRSTDGTSKIRGYIRELVKAGHAHRVAHKDPETHQIIEWVLEVYELPFTPKATPPVSIGVASHQVENRTLNNNDLVNENEFNDIGADAPNLSIENQIYAGQATIVISEDEQFRVKAKDAANLINFQCPGAGPLAETFMLARRIIIPQSKAKGNRKAAREMLDQNVKPEHVSKATTELMEKGMTVVDLFSVSKTAIDLANRVSKPEPYHPEYQPLPQGDEHAVPNPNKRRPAIISGPHPGYRTPGNDSE